MSFLDILVEQGLIGLGIWFFLFLMVYFNFYTSYRKGYKLTTLDISLMAAFMGVLLLTNINPFINNPIGICFFLIVLVASQNIKYQSLKGNVK
jgi:O-antigen ligase